MTRCRTAVLAACVAAQAGVAGAQDTRVRADFEGRAAPPAATTAAAPVPGPRVRADFEGRSARADATAVAPAYAPGPRVRADFEGRASATPALAAVPATAPAPTARAEPALPGANRTPLPAPVPRTSFPARPANARARIEQVRRSACSPAGEFLTLDGRGFGGEPGGWRVALGTSAPKQYVLEVRSWSENRIVAKMPGGSVPAVAYPVAVLDAERRPVSNTDQVVTACP